MCDISNIKNMRTAKIGGTAKEILMVKAALCDLTDYMISLSAEIYGENCYTEQFNPIANAIDKVNDGVDKMLLQSINLHLECGVGTVI